VIDRDRSERRRRNERGTLTKSSGRIRLIIIQLDIRIRHRLVETLRHRFDPDLFHERVGEDVSGRDLDRLLPQIVFQDVAYETRVDLGSVAGDIFPVGEDLVRRGGRVEPEVYTYG
jgi:hypothetical protein